MIDQLYNDTIYSIGQPGQVEPKFFFEIRKNRMPAESYRRPENLINYSADKARYSRWVVTDRWIFLNGTYFNKVRNIVYDRKSTTCEYVPYLAGFHNALIENDLDRGPPFWFKGSTFTGDLFNVIHPYKIIEYNENGLLYRHTPKDKKAVSVFSKMKSELSENDNPVIQIIQLKN
ncbi:MAG: hypothetical protein A2X22_03145 [Bacteroidetes bacterium GWF2_49_14]|nr:MAG: hypothetical protein A2X22_03145 [Bacteroidetes bacterium GWF2_49_14]HBB93038.1 hypothetical protein [Bacteroidales bacterium]